MSKAKSKELDPKLVKAIKYMLDEVMEKPAEGKVAVYSLSERCKIFDRFIKIESMRLQIQDDDSGNFFKQKEEDNEHE